MYALEYTVVRFACSVCSGDEQFHWPLIFILSELYEP